MNLKRPLGWSVLCCSLSFGGAFQPKLWLPETPRCGPRSFDPQSRSVQPLFVSEMTQDGTATVDSPTTASTITTPGMEEAAKLLAQAERMRLEADQMSVSLTQSKIAAIEKKLTNKAWVAKHPDEEAVLVEQLSTLKGESTTTTKTATVRKQTEALKENGLVAEATPTSSPSKKPTAEQKADKPIPLSGFDDDDLALYLPVAIEIEERMKEFTLKERIEAFRTAPELQDHFQKKISEMLVKPMADMQKLEELKSNYLYSTSSTEKGQIKRDIKRLEESMEGEGPIMYSDSIYRETRTLEEEEVQQRLEAVGALPELLQFIYMERCGVTDGDDLRLAIELDHYDFQLQLLEQVRYVAPLSGEKREEVSRAIGSLPLSVRAFLGKKIGLKEEDITDKGKMIDQLCEAEDDGIMGNQLKDLVKAAALPDLPEYDDIDFIDRSRYVEEFYPSVARLEGYHPKEGEIDVFMQEVLSRKTFMVNSKPERVMGGYFIRGDNLIADDEESGKELVARLDAKLKKSPLADKVTFFFIGDPSPLTDEEAELGMTEQPLLLVTAKNNEVFYNYAQPAAKIALSALWLFSITLFGLVVCEYQPHLRDQMYAYIDAPTTTDLSWLGPLVGDVVLSSVAIQVAHESAHQISAWKDKFEAGLPTLLPSIQLGSMGAVTPFKSPPPGFKALFDFSIAGPLAGMAASLAFLLVGLSMTASTDLGQSMNLPAIEPELLKCSALGGGLIELFLGRGIVSQGAEDVVVALHPFAITGFAGLVTNALALLPLGNTDGGRIALAMFGRRGAYIVKTFTTAILCIAGLFGLDDASIFLVYVLFVTLWQRELETPVRNEVEELDIGRGVVGIGAAVLVALTLCPMIF